MGNVLHASRGTSSRMRIASIQLSMVQSVPTTRLLIVVNVRWDTTLTITGVSRFQVIVFVSTMRTVNVWNALVGGLLLSVIAFEMFNNFIYNYNDTTIKKIKSQ